MKFFDPQREKDSKSQNPLIAGSKVRLPDLLITPIERLAHVEGDLTGFYVQSWSVRVWLPSGERNSYSARECETDDITEFLLLWLENPEKVLLDQFGFQASKLKVSGEDVLKELGL